MAQMSALLNVMVAAAIKAGRKLKRDFGEVENLQVSVKGPADFVTNADKLCLLYTSPSPRDLSTSRMPSSA